MVMVRKVMTNCRRPSYSSIYLSWFELLFISMALHLWGRLFILTVGEHQVGHANLGFWTTPFLVSNRSGCQEANTWWSISQHSIFTGKKSERHTSASGPSALMLFSTTSSTSLTSSLGSSVDEWGEEDDRRMLGGRREDCCFPVEDDHHSPSLLWENILLFLS